MSEFDSDKLRALDEWLKERIPDEDEFQQFGPVNIFRECQEVILAMVEREKRLREALESIAKHNTLGTPTAEANIARRALGEEKAS